MAVLVEAISVVIRLETIEEKYPGGVDQYIEDCPDRTFCKDDSITRVGFMCPDDVNAFVENLEGLGFNCLVDEEFDEIAVVDQIDEIVFPCDWLEKLEVKIFEGNKKLSICQIKGVAFNGIVLPSGWNYEDSLSKRVAFMDVEDKDKRMIFLRHEDSFDIYLDIFTHEELSILRTSKRKANA